MLPLSLLVVFPLAAVATLNGHCTGSKATGVFGEDGICITTTTCSHYGGATTTGACPDDPNDVKCCVIGVGESAGADPCGLSSFCTWTTNSCLPIGFVTGDCPGGSNYKCCKA